MNFWAFIPSQAKSMHVLLKQVIRRLTSYLILGFFFSWDLFHLFSLLLTLRDYIDLSKQQ
jgi:hypothetical protein